MSLWRAPVSRTRVFAEIPTRLKRNKFPPDGIDRGGGVVLSDRVQFGKAIVENMKLLICRMELNAQKAGLCNLYGLFTGVTFFQVNSPESEKVRFIDQALAS